MLNRPDLWEMVPLLLLPTSSVSFCLMEWFGLEETLENPQQATA